MTMPVSVKTQSLSNMPFFHDVISNLSQRYSAIEDAMLVTDLMNRAAKVNFADDVNFKQLEFVMGLIEQGYGDSQAIELFYNSDPNTDRLGFYGAFEVLVNSISQSLVDEYHKTKVSMGACGGDDYHIDIARLNDSMFHGMVISHGDFVQVEVLFTRSLSKEWRIWIGEFVGFGLQSISKGFLTTSDIIEISRERFCDLLTFDGSDLVLNRNAVDKLGEAIDKGDLTHDDALKLIQNCYPHDQKRNAETTIAYMCEDYDSIHAEMNNWLLLYEESNTVSYTEKSIEQLISDMPPIVTTGDKELFDLVNELKGHLLSVKPPQYENDELAVGYRDIISLTVTENDYAVTLLEEHVNGEYESGEDAYDFCTTVESVKGYLYSLAVCHAFIERLGKVLV